MEISEKVAYLKGLAEGLALDTDSKEGKLIAAIIEVLDDMAEKFVDIEDELCDVEDGLDAVSDDLSDVEETLYEALEDEDEDEEDDDEEYFVTTCPACEEEVVFDETVLADGEVICPNCGSKLRKGVDTWPLCPFCGEDVTAPGRPSSCTVLLKVNCGEKDIRRVWYTGNRDFFDYWESFAGHHSKHEYHFSAERAVLTVEDAKNRSERTASELPDELPASHTLLKQARFSGEIDGERVDGIRTENLGTVDLAELSEAERLAFLKILLTTKPDREKRRFNLT